MTKKLHSAEYFGDQRDDWWNRDFLELMSRRWGLHEVHSVVDVGCGIGHWSQALAPFLPSDARVLGIDREPVWVEKAGERTKSFQLEQTFTYQQGEAENLPVEDGSFDMVTCQTLLIHVKEPQRVIREMLRALKPGGLIVAAEPNNMLVRINSLNMEGPIHEILDPLKIQMMCERGKMALGEGYNSLGELIPGYFAETGIQDIQVYLSDKATAIFPPYEDKKQKNVVQEWSNYSEKEFVRWDREDTLRYFLAGGGTPEEFEIYWTKAIRENREFAHDFREKKYHTAGGNMLYLISGRKPL